MKIAILGTVGVPGRYGGFETLAENLVKYADIYENLDDELTVYCSTRAYPEKSLRFFGARLRYSRLKANGVQSVPYDVLTALDAVARRHDTLVFLGVSGAIVLPVLRRLCRAKLIVNVGGIDWKRQKWKGLAKHFLRWSEALAVRYAHAVIADNKGIAEYLHETYSVEAEVISYGGDHALESNKYATLTPPLTMQLPPDYALAFCRIEKDNNVEMILEAFDATDKALVFVGNWDQSRYGRALKARFSDRPGLYLLDPIHDPERRYIVRAGASSYVHGHSAGGTNPALVEMMYFGVPVLAFDCNFNRYTTEDKATYFKSAEDLQRLLVEERVSQKGFSLREIAQRRYRWEIVGRQYFDLIFRLNDRQRATPDAKPRNCP